LHHLKSIHLKKINIYYLVAILMVTSLLFAPKMVGAGSLVRITTTDNLKIDSDIVVEFDVPIQFDFVILVNTPSIPSTTFGGIELVEVVGNTSTPVQIRLAISGTKLRITPVPQLTRNTQYELRITDHVVQDTFLNHILPLTGVVVNIKRRIGTFSLTFEQLMAGGNPQINGIINEYTPRNIMIKTPERYIENLEVIHKRREVVHGLATESITNLDISINDYALYNVNGDINRIEILAKAGNSILRKVELEYLNVTTNTGTRIYDIGFTKLPDTRAFDIEILLYDNNDDLLDSRLIKIPLDTNIITTVKQRDRYKMAGRWVSFYGVLSTTRDFQTLLDENRMKELKVQVVER
jgi:hypothetical protein